VKICFHLGLCPGDLMDLCQEDPRSQKRDLGHPSVVYLWFFLQLELVPQKLVIYIVMELDLGNLDQAAEQPRASVG
jgi:hypothetical protein